MTNNSSFLADPSLIDRYLSLRDEAIRHTLPSCIASCPGLIEQLGQRGRDACAEDLGHHLDFLRPTLESGDLSPFTSYLAWLADVLASRSIPADSVPDSLENLATFFASKLGDNSAPVVAALRAGRQAMIEGIAAPTYDQPCPTPWAEAEAFCDAVLKGNRHEATALFTSALDREQSLVKAAVHVIQPALYAVGRRWQNNSVSVAQEHLATSLAQTVMTQGFGRFDVAPDNGRRAIFACMAGNQHTVGLRMVADAFEFDGWTSHYLGANVPLSALVAQVRTLRPHLVGLSASLPYHLRGLRETISVLHAAFAEDCPHLVVGGLVFNQFPQLAESLGAELLGTDAFAAAAAIRERLQATAL
jgi:methanogenic corrinoid protein MtbC1